MPKLIIELDLENPVQARIMLDGKPMSGLQSFFVGLDLTEGKFDISWCKQYATATRLTNTVEERD